jgi:F-type H+-transporting ATPase subunit b
MRRHLRSGVLAAGLCLVRVGPLLAQEEGGGSLLNIRPGLVIWTWIIFLALLFVLRKWAWGPIVGALEARERRIQEALDEATREREEAHGLLEEHRKLLNQARNEAQEILAEGRKAAERFRAEMLEEGRQQKEEIVARARDEIARERDQALDALRREAVDLSITAASRVLEKNLDSEDNRRLALEYVDRLTEGRSNGGQR